MQRLSANLRGLDTHRTLLIMGSTILLLHLLGFGSVLAAAQGGPRLALSFGVAVAAYTLGMRHAFDADHIAAIDNTTRKLRQDGLKPLSVGFWFSLGHSTVVIALALMVIVGTRRLYGLVAAAHSPLHSLGAVVGTLVSALFLFVIASLNLRSLISTLRTAHTDGNAPPDLPGGPLQFLFGRLLKGVRRPAGMYPVGLLFGLGFDTATEVVLLATTASAAAAPLPWYGVLALPFLFAAGMSLCDTLDGIWMQYAYTWTLIRPERRRTWNVSVTLLSLVAAFTVGSMEIAGLVAQTWPWAARATAFLTGADSSRVGIIMVVSLLLAWLLALGLWHENGLRKPLRAVLDTGRHNVEEQRRSPHERPARNMAAIGPEQSAGQDPLATRATGAAFAAHGGSTGPPCDRVRRS